MSALTPEEKRTLALKARRMKTAAGEREAHSLKDIKDFLEDAAEDDAADSSKLPVRLAKIRFGGSVVTS